MEGQEMHCPHRIDPLTELLYREQTGNVQDYFDSFNLLLSRVNISENLATEIFLRGLEPAIQKCVRCFEPRDVKSAYYLARLKESTIPVLGLKEEVISEEMGIETCGTDDLESAIGLEQMEMSHNAVVLEVFDEMPKKNDVEVLGKFAAEDNIARMVGTEDMVLGVNMHLYELFGDKNFGECLVQKLNGEVLVEFDLMCAIVPANRDHNYDGDVPLIINTAQPGYSRGFSDQYWRRNYEYKLFMAGTQRATTRPHGYPSRHKCNLRLGIVRFEGSLLQTTSGFNLFFDEPWRQGSLGGVY